MTVLSAEQIADYAYAAGFPPNTIGIAVAVALAESSGRTDAVNNTVNDSTYGPVVGLWQIRSLRSEKNTGGDRDELANYDPAHNALSAYHISGGGTNWSPWDTFKDGAYKSHLNDAQQAADSVISRGGAGGSVSSFVGDVAYPVPDPTPLPIDPIPLKDVSSLLCFGQDAKITIGDAFVSGTVDMTSDKVAEISVKFIDPDFLIWSAPWKTQGTPFVWDEWNLDLAGVTAAEEDGVNYTTILLWPRGIVTLQQTQGDTRTNLSSGQWIAAEAAKVGIPFINYEAQGVTKDSIGPVNTSMLGNTVLPTSDGSGIPKPPESTWSTMKRLADEDGCVLFAYPEGTLIYGKPTILTRALSYADVGFRGSVNNDPALDFVRIEPEMMSQTTSWIVLNKIATVYLSRSRGERFRPGMAIRLPGFSGFDNGKYFISEVTWPLDGGVTEVTIHLEVPVDPTPQKITTSLGAAAVQSLSSGQGGTKTANDFVAFAAAQVGDQYVFGAAPDPSNPDPSQFDCSSLVQWAAAQDGISLPRTVNEIYDKCFHITVDQAKTIRGALIFKLGTGADGHVVISLGDGKSTVEARGAKYGVVTYTIDNRGFDAAGLIQGMNYGPTRDTATSGYNGPVGPEHLQGRDTATSGYNGPVGPQDVATGVW